MINQKNKAIKHFFSDQNQPGKIYEEATNYDRVGDMYRFEEDVDMNKAQTFVLNIWPELLF